MKIAIALFPGLTALDAVGPYEVLSRLPGAETAFVGHAVGVVRTDAGSLGLAVDRLFEDLPSPDVLVVPGGPGVRELSADDRLRAWIVRAHETSTYTVSVCTGALALGAAGLLAGLEATTHWRFYDALAAHGARPTARRVVESGKIITAAGVSAGIDMALVLAAKIAGHDVAKAIQLSIEYDPQPPFDAGSVAKAPPSVVALVNERARQREAERAARAGR
jgi:transcriptional regulator GlxA family with amidase domain